MKAHLEVTVRVPGAPAKALVLEVEPTAMHVADAAKEAAGVLLAEVLRLREEADGESSAEEATPLAA